MSSQNTYLTNITMEAESGDGERERWERGNREEKRVEAGKKIRVGLRTRGTRVLLENVRMRNTDECYVQCCF